MHFLVDASLPSATVPLIRSAAHEATDVRDIGLRCADDSIIARLAREQKYCLISRDGDFGNMLDYPPKDYWGIVVIDTPDGAGRNVVLEMIGQFLKEKNLIEKLPGRLAIVQRHRIRLRPA